MSNYSTKGNSYSVASKWAGYSTRDELVSSVSKKLYDGFKPTGEVLELSMSLGDNLVATMGNLGDFDESLDSFPTFMDSTIEAHKSGEDATKIGLMLDMNSVVTAVATGALAIGDVVDVISCRQNKLIHLQFAVYKIEKATRFDLVFFMEVGAWGKIDSKLQKIAEMPIVKRAKIKAQKAAKALGGAALKGGSEAQKKWAEELRSGVLSKLSPATADKVLSDEKYRSAKWWIDNRELYSSVSTSFGKRSTVFSDTATMERVFG